MIEYSVIIPVYDEQECLEQLYRSLSAVMRSLGLPFEIIVVDDGSSDASADILKGISSADAPELVIVKLESHQGKSAALEAGFAHSRGKTIITLDADMQYEPKDIRLLLNKKNDGFDVVCGWRYQRHDPWMKILASRIANFLRRLAFKETINDVGCSFRVYSRQAFGSLNLYRQRHRFITAILLKKGFKLAEVKVTHYHRSLGVSKYGIMDRLLSSIPDFFEILIKR